MLCPLKPQFQQLSIVPSTRPETMLATSLTTKIRTQGSWCESILCNVITPNVCFTFSCAPAWEDPANIGYTWYLMILGFLLPLVIIAYTSADIICVLNKVVELNLLVLL